MKEETLGPTAESLEQEHPLHDELLQWDVVDAQNEHVGKVETAWLDLATGQVEFIGVRTHWLTGKVLGVPILHAELCEDVRSIRLPYSMDTIKQAPRFALHGTLDDEQKTAIYEHYK